MPSRKQKSLAALLGLTSASSMGLSQPSFGASSCSVTVPTEQQVATVIASSPAVKAADAALLSTQSVLTTRKSLEAKALKNYQKALKTPSKSDDVALLRAYQSAKQSRVSAEASVTSAQNRANSARQNIRDQISAQYSSLCTTVTALSVSVDPGSDQVKLAWNTVAGATAYVISRDKIEITTTDARSYLDTAVHNGTTYSYTVTAIAAIGADQYITLTSTEVTTTAVLPKPTNLVATPGSNQVSLSWSASATATGYKIYRDGQLLTSLSTTTYVDSTAKNGKTYSYTVSATNEGGESSQSTAKSATPQVPAPSAPTGLTATAGNNQVSLSWNIVTGATSYTIYRGATAVVTQAGTTYTDIGLTNGTAYTYIVKATNAGGDSPSSASVSVTPAAPTLAAPTGLKADTATSLNAGKFRLSWNAVNGATGYTIFLTKPGGVATQLGTVSGTTTYTPTTTTPGSTGSYTVMATNGTPSANSNQSAPLVAGVYQGSAVNDQFRGNVYGQIQVSVIVTGKSITGCWATYPTSSDSGPINGSAIPKLCSSVLTVQPTSANATTSIASVSGASATSPAFKTSLANALTQAGL